MRRLLNAAQLVAAGVVATRLVKGARRTPPLQPMAGESAADVTVVIPARNEESRLGACLASLPSDVEVIVVDDGSTDATGAIAREAGARVVSAPPVPSDWIGKPWALQHGLAAAATKYVVFVDADVRFAPDAIDAIVRPLESADVVTLSATLVSPSLLASALSASMVAGLVYRFGAVGVNVADPNRTIGNGQCIAMRREQLTAAGGFELAAGNMTDDIALLRSLRRQGLSIAFLDGSRLIETAMYESAAETWREWPRSLPMNDVISAQQRVVDTAVLWLTLALPTLRMVARRATVVDKALLGQRWLLSLALAPSFKGFRLGVYLSPLVDVPVLARLTWTTVKPVRRWRGRWYAPPKSEGR